MEYSIKLKTTRTKDGYANASITKFFNYSDNKVQWGFRFYQTRKWFDSKRELLDWINNNYDVIDWRGL